MDTYKWVLQYLSPRYSPLEKTKEYIFLWEMNNRAKVKALETEMILFYSSMSVCFWAWEPRPF